MKNVDFLMCGGERLVIVRNVRFFLYYKFLCVFESFFYCFSDRVFLY